jgi:hypothetical protein
MTSAEGYEEIYRILRKAGKHLRVLDMRAIMEICEGIESDAYVRGYRDAQATVDVWYPWYCGDGTHHAPISIKTVSDLWQAG